MSRREFVGAFGDEGIYDMRVPVSSVGVGVLKRGAEGSGDQGSAKIPRAARGQGVEVPPSASGSGRPGSSVNPFKRDSSASPLVGNAKMAATSAGPAAKRSARKGGITESDAMQRMLKRYLREGKLYFSPEERSVIMSANTPGAVTSVINLMNDHADFLRKLKAVGLNETRCIKKGLEGLEVATDKVVGDCDAASKDPDCMDGFLLQCQGKTFFKFCLDGHAFLLWTDETQGDVEDLVAFKTRVVRGDKLYLFALNDDKKKCSSFMDVLSMAEVGVRYGCLERGHFGSELYDIYFTKVAHGDIKREGVIDSSSRGSRDG